MTRRLRRSRRTLGLDAYVRRATQGLPREERLDAAAELRTHLLGRVAEHQAQGFSREEAEYLVVRGMGDPHPVNRRLLGHAFTYRAGWAVLGLLLLGGGSWWTYREWLPPREGVVYGAATSGDIARLFADKDAPRGTYQAATLTFPKGTRSVVYANVASSKFKNGNDDVFADMKDVEFLTSQNIRGRVPGSHRYQERLLMTSERLNCGGHPFARLYVTSYILPSPFWNAGPNSFGMGQITEKCSNPKVRLRRLGGSSPRTIGPDGEGVTRISAAPLPLRLNEWTVLGRLAVDPQSNPNTIRSPDGGGYSQKARGVFVAVLPLDRGPQGGNSGYSYGAGIVRLSGDAQDLPPLPPTVPR